MLRLIHQIMVFASSYAARIRVSWIFSFLKSLCANGPVIVAIVLVNMLLEDSGTAALPSPSADVPEIEFRHVSFAYGAEEVLHDVSFALLAGFVMYAIVRKD